MTEQAPATDQWDEENSQLFLEMSALFVPARAEQTNALLELIPAQRDEVFTIAELAAGGGELAETILEHFPNAHYLALDGSKVMLEQLHTRLARFGERVTLREFDIAEQGWRAQLPSPLRCVLSSLCVHHLSDEGKRQLFNDMLPRLEPGGTLLLADIVRPANQRSADLFAQQYDEIVREQSLAARGDLSGFQSFTERQWNYFRYDYTLPDTIDTPSLLSDQLVWLREASFSTVDCYWMRAGHAVYGGYR
ncbi:MAG TPA: class I SAM-dependent methyltransferase [Ktedonobacteraceae bacterium]|nr:class I SAM-dependent methyltransferase [Ktedonobacteraceae bacterium]